MPWCITSGRTVPWRSASELSRLRLKRQERLVCPDAKDAIFFFPMSFRCCQVHLKGMNIVATKGSDAEGDVWSASKRSVHQGTNY